MSEIQTAQSASVEDIARELAKANGDSDRQITVIRWFPDPNVVRLVVVDPRTPVVASGEPIAPFYFGADDSGSMPYQSAIAMVSPGDDRSAELPDGWGTWRDAIEVWNPVVEQPKSTLGGVSNAPNKAMLAALKEVQRLQSNLQPTPSGNTDSLILEARSGGMYNYDSRK